MQIGFFGEVMQEHRADGAGYGFGGDTLNTALYLHRLSRQTGAGITVQYFSMLGSDAASDVLINRLAGEGLQLRLARHPDKSIGQYWIDTDALGERSFRYQRDDSAARYYFRLQSEVSAAAGFRSSVTALEQALSSGELQALYLSGISLAIFTESERMRLYSAVSGFVRRGGQLIYDNNFRPLLWQAADAARWQQLLLPLCSLVLLTDSDERLIWQRPCAGAADLVDAALQAGARTVVLKCGPAPCWIAQQQGVAAALQVAAQAVAQVVDSSGAGDAFAAGFLAAFLSEPASAEPVSTRLQTAAVWGHQLAAAVVQQHGAVIAPAQMPQFFLTTQEATDVA